MKSAALVLVIVSCGWWPSPSFAQSPSALPRAEIWGGLAIATPSSGGAVTATYPPVLNLGGTPLESRVTQQLEVNVGAGTGFDLGLNVFASRHVGVQFGLARTTGEIDGSPGSYTSYLRYVARYPPDYQPREVTYERTTAWEPASGTWSTLSMAVGGVARWTAAAGRVGGTVAGGVLIDRYSGEVQNLAYTQFVLGGHSTLFPVTHRVVLVPVDGERTVRPYVSGDVHVRVAPRVAVVGGVRVALGADAEVLLGADRLVDPSEDAWAPELADVQRVAGRQPLVLPVARWRLAIGVKVFVG